MICYHINTALTYYAEIIIITNLADVLITRRESMAFLFIEISLILFTWVVLIFNVISCIRYAASFVFSFVFFLAFAVVSFIASFNIYTDDLI